MLADHQRASSSCRVVENQNTFLTEISQGLCGPQLTCQKQGADQFPTCVKMDTHCIDAQTKYDEARSFVKTHNNLY